jgi:hypothetical protein
MPFFLEDFDKRLEKPYYCTIDIRKMDSHQTPPELDLLLQEEHVSNTVNFFNRSTVS